MAAYVYFISDGQATKVGWSRDPERRLKQMQPGSSRPLRMVHTVRGNWRTERVIHAHLADRHLHHEWFDGAMTLDECRDLALQALSPDADIVHGTLLREPDERPYDAFDEALYEGEGLRDHVGRVVWSDDEGTWVRFVALSKLLQRDTDLRLAGGSRAMRDHFSERFELLDRRTCVPGTETYARSTLVVGFHLH